MNWLHHMKTDLQLLNEKFPAPFGDDIIQNYNEYIIENDIYLWSEEKQLVTDIPLDMVTGIDQGYGGKTWAQCLNGAWLDRLSTIMSDLKRKPYYYLRDCPKFDMDFIKVGDDYFIRQGKHRTVIARFLAHYNPEYFSDRSPLKNIPVREYFIDNKYPKIKAVLFEIEKLHPELHFNLERTTALDDEKFLRVQSISGHEIMKCISRLQVDEVLSRHNVFNTFTEIQRDEFPRAIGTKFHKVVLDFETQLLGLDVNRNISWYRSLLDRLR